MHRPLRAMIEGAAGPARARLAARLRERRVLFQAIEPDAPPPELVLLLLEGDADPIAACRAARARAGEAALLLALGARPEHGMLAAGADRCLPVDPSDAALDEALHMVRRALRPLRSEADTRALQESEARFRALVQHSYDVIAVLDADLFVRFVSPSFERMFGVPAERVMARQVLSLVHPDDQAAANAMAAQLLERPGESVHGRFRLRHAEGGWVPIEAVGTNSLAEPAVRGIVVNARDVGERLRTQERQLFTDRMATVGTLAAGVAHEINNPLAYVLANLGLMQDEVARLAPALPRDALQEMTDLLRETSEGAERVRRIVRDLMSFSRTNDAAVGPVDVNALLDSTLNIACGELRVRARLVRTYGVVPPVIASEARLAQVFLSVIVNAVQAIPEHDPGHNEIEVRTGTGADGRVRVEVRDTGTGMAPEVLDRVFDPFFTTKPPGVGTGLGLSVCHGIVTGLGGEIEIDSAPGEGTTVRLLLPARRAASPGPAAAHGPDQPTPLRALVVADEPAVAQALRRLLRGHDVTIALDGPDAVELCRASELDVVFCDLVLGGMSGVDVHEAVVGFDPALADRFVFMSGGACPPRARAFVAQAGHPVLEKPFDPAAVRHVLARAQRATDPGPIAKT